MLIGRDFIEVSIGVGEIHGKGHVVIIYFERDSFAFQMDFHFKNCSPLVPKATVEAVAGLSRSQEGEVNLTAGVF